MFPPPPKDPASHHIIAGRVYLACGSRSWAFLVARVRSPKTGFVNLLAPPSTVNCKSASALVAGKDFRTNPLIWTLKTVASATLPVPLPPNDVDFKRDP
jgi:hypothetical protein